MGNDRVKLPWEREESPAASKPSEPESGDSHSDQPQVEGNTEPVPQPSSDPAAAGWQVAGAATRDAPSTADPDDVPEPVAGKEARLDREEPIVAKAVPRRAEAGEGLPGDLPRSERSGPWAMEPASSGQPTLVNRVRSAFGRNPPQETPDDWMQREKPVGTYDSWLFELTAAPPSTTTEPADVESPGNSVTSSVEFEPIGGEDDETDAVGVLAGPRSAVDVPRFAKGRIGLIAGAVAIALIAVGAYAYAYPEIRGRQYSSELSKAYGSTNDLREALPGYLDAELPRDLASEAVTSRRLADTFGPYSKTVNAPAPGAPAFAISSALSRARLARARLAELNESLGPATDQLRARSAYYEAIDAVRQQMNIASNVVQGGAFEGGDVTLILDGTVGNATSLDATLASQKPPVGFEEFNRKLDAFLRDYVQLGRSYALAIKRSDPAAESIKSQIQLKAREFDSVLKTPIGPGMSPADQARFEELQRAADSTLNGQA